MLIFLHDEGMELAKSGHYSPWFASDEDYFDKNREDSWISYLHRSLHHQFDEGIPFPDSSWIYSKETSPFTGRKSDESIHYEVLDKLYANNKLDASRIIVMVVNGNVHLEGEVSSPDQISLASTIVNTIPEVWSIQNELTVTTQS